MKPLAGARQELFLAKRSLFAIRKEAMPFLAESRWREFLNHLEKSWVKAAIPGRPIGAAFWQFNAPYKAERETDPLLRYLSQARHADNHSAQRLALAAPGLLAKWLPKNISIRVNGPRLVPLPVTNRGVTFPVPTHHLGTEIPNLTVIDLGKLGCRYYEQYFQVLQAKFFKDAP